VQKANRDLGWLQESLLAAIQLELSTIPPYLYAIWSIDPQATEFYRLFDEAYKMIENNDITGAIATLNAAVRADLEDSLGHFMLGTALSANDQESDALPEFRKAVALSPRNPKFLDHLAMSLFLNGDQDGAVVQLQKAVALDPTSVEYPYNLGFVFESRGDFFDAVSPLEKAVELSHAGNWRCLAELGKVYNKIGRPSDAARATRMAIELAEQQNDLRDARELRETLTQYESEAGQTTQ